MPIPPIIENVKTGFENAQADGKISTERFLSACESLLPVFDFLGSRIFGLAKSDIRGNIDVRVPVRSTFLIRRRNDPYHRKYEPFNVFGVR